MNAVDRVIATSLCPLFLCGISVSLFIASLDRSLSYQSILLGGAILVFIFNVRVIGKMYQRKRIYDVLRDRISEGYSKELFFGKCPTICSLTLCCYILLRIGKVHDVPYLFDQFFSRNATAIHPDKDIEAAINQAVFGMNIEALSEAKIN